MDPLCGIRNISHIVKLMQMLLCHMLEFYATVPRDIQFRIKCSPENKRNAVYRLLFCDHHFQIKKFGSIFKGVNDFYSIVQPVCTCLLYTSVAFPGHEPDQQVFTQCNFTVIRGRTVCDHFAGFNMLSIEHDRSLVDACSLVGTLELQQLVFVFSLTVITKYYDPVCIDKINGACMFRCV